MLSVINVCTNSIDDLDVACEEIMAQLKDKPLLKNSVGIFGCHFDYVEENVIAAIKKSLPFDIVGCSTLGSAINGHGGMEQLTLTILTSDDVVFSTALSDTISSDNFDAPIENVYAEAKKSLETAPKLIVVIAPITPDVAGDRMLAKLDQLSGKVPVFGTLASDISPGYAKGFVCRNDEFARSKMALLMMSGNINPRFHITSIAKRNIQQNNAIVTGVDGYVVTSINDMPVLDYFTSLGILTGDGHNIAPVTMIPFLVDFGDGTEPVAYSMYNITADGAYCGGAIPHGAKITFAEIDMPSILETAEITLRSALDDVEKNGANGIIAIPCFARSMVMSPNVEGEIVKSLEIIGDKVPFSLIYSGGEICPVYNKQHETVNRFHNLTYTLVVF